MYLGNVSYLRVYGHSEMDLVTARWSVLLSCKSLCRYVGILYAAAGSPETLQ